MFGLAGGYCHQYLPGNLVMTPTKVTYIQATGAIGVTMNKPDYIVVNDRKTFLFTLCKTKNFFSK